MREISLEQAASSVPDVRVGRATLEGEETTRSLLAADIHDDSVQAMVAADLKLQDLKRKLNPEAAMLVAETQELVRDATRRMRRLLFELSPIQPGVSLEDTIQAYIDRSMEGISCTFVKRLDFDLPADVATVAYRIIQEALTNVRRHSAANSVRVEVRGDNEGLLVEVTDNGRGFESRFSKPGHLGLTSMHQRAEENGGWLAVVSRPNTGTTIAFRLDIPCLNRAPAGEQAPQALSQPPLASGPLTGSRRANGGAGWPPQRPPWESRRWYVQATHALGRFFHWRHITR